MDKEYKRFLALRRRVMQAIHRELEQDSCCKSYEEAFEILVSYPDYRELEQDSCCKSYEGAFEILVSYPDYFDREYDNKPDQPDFYLIRLHCYVLGPGRHYEWKGRTLKKALDKAEKDINQWIREADNGT